jgi:hypothetical protein
MTKLEADGPRKRCSIPDKANESSAIQSLQALLCGP